MNTELTREQFAEYFFLHIRRRFKRQKVAAEFYGCSDAMISAIATGKKPPTKEILADIGVTREVIKTEVYRLNNEPQTS